MPGRDASYTLSTGRRKAGVASSRSHCHSFDAGIQAAFGTRGFIFMDKPLADSRVDDGNGFTETGLHFLQLARFDGVKDLLDVSPKFTALRHIAVAMLFRLAGAFFGRSDIGQENLSIMKKPKKELSSSVVSLVN